MLGLPGRTQVGSGLARPSGHELGSFPTKSLQFRVICRALAALHSRVELCASGCDEVCGHPLDIGLRQLSGVSGADEPGLLAYLTQQLRADVLGRGAEGGDFR